MRLFVFIYVSADSWDSPAGKKLLQDFFNAKVKLWKRSGNISATLYIWVFSENLGLFRFVTKQFCLFQLFRYRFETPKQTEIFRFWFHETNRNKRETDLVSVRTEIYFCCFEDTLVMTGKKLIRIAFWNSGHDILVARSVQFSLGVQLGHEESRETWSV